MSALILAAVVLALSVPLTWLIDRQLAREARERRLRELLAPIARDFDRLKLTIGLALMPAMGRAVGAAIEFERSMRQVHDVMRTKADISKFIKGDPK